MYYPDRAQEIALENEQQYHLAAWFKSGGELTFGTNSDKCSARFRRQYKDGSIGYHLHAEMDLLLKMGHNIADEICVIRFKKNGDITMAKPCRYCQKFLKTYGVKRVRYTNWDGKWESMRL